MIVYNLLFLIVANLLIPLSPLPPIVHSIIPFFEPIIIKQSSLFRLLDLKRIYSDADFKSSLRQAMKQHHPDKGGSAESFQRVRNAKKVLLHQQKPYDRLGIESFASDKQEDLKQQIQNNTKVYYMELIMFYIISLIFSMAVTYQLEQRYLRKYIVLVLAFGVGMEIYYFTNSNQKTIIDFLFSGMPLFQQFTLMRNMISVIVAIILAIHSRKQTREKEIIKRIPELIGKQPLKVTQSLKELETFYEGQLKRRETYEKSLLSKVRNYLVKGISLFCLGMMVYSFIRK